MNHLTPAPRLRSRVLIPLSLSILAIGVPVLAAESAEAAGKSLRCEGKRATITEDSGGKAVGAGRDYIQGTNRSDVIVTLGGDDEVYGGGGNDLICLGSGNDYGLGESGADTIHGDEGVDYIVGYTGDDLIYGDAGDDWSKGVQDKQPGKNGRLVGGPGDDEIHGGDGRDLLRGNEGDERMYGEAGDDDLDAGAGNDLCAGGEDYDRGSECESLSGIDDSSWLPTGRISA